MSATPRPKVLVIEDSQETIAILRHAFVQHGYDMQAVHDGKKGLVSARDWRPDIIVLDLGLPDMDGLEVAQELRKFTDAYILVLTSRSEEKEKISGFEAGADEYLVKPFSHRELIVRMGALLRRPRSSERKKTEVFEFEGMKIDEARREIWIDGKSTDLTRIEFEILLALAREKGGTLSRDALLRSVWGPNWYGDAHVVDVHVSNLRKKIGDSGSSSRFIRSVRGIGYRIAAAIVED